MCRAVYTSGRGCLVITEVGADVIFKLESRLSLCNQSLFWFFFWFAFSRHRKESHLSFRPRLQWSRLDQIHIPSERKYLALCLQLPAKTDTLRDLPHFERNKKTKKQKTMWPQGQRPHLAGSEGGFHQSGRGLRPLYDVTKGQLNGLSQRCFMQQTFTSAPCDRSTWAE